MECSPNVLNQDIRIVCSGSAEDCDRLKASGPEGKVVRLPENVSFYTSNFTAVVEYILPISVAKVPSRLLPKHGWPRTNLSHRLSLRTSLDRHLLKFKLSP